MTGGGSGMSTSWNETEKSLNDLKWSDLELIVANQQGMRAFLT